MTDNEIIKALEHEIHIANDIGGVHSMMIPIEPIKCVLDLINRQQAEIERLEKENQSIKYCYQQAKSYNDTLAESCEKNCKKFNMVTRAEAIKEFAELVKMEFYKEFDELIPSIMADSIDNLVKEMTEECEK